jgi:chitodextrinase
MKKITLFIGMVMCFLSCTTTNNNTVTVVPLAPSNLTGTVISTTQINLSWTDNATNEDGYEIERKTGNGNYTVVGSMGSDLTTYNDLGLIPNTSYTYRVYAYNSAGNSIQYSNEVTVSTQDSIPSWLTNGLVAFYPFNGNANDESGNGNNGTVNGATLTTDRFGNTGKAYNFTGNTTVPSYIEGPCSNFPTSTRTVSFWFYGNDIGVGSEGRALLGYGGQICGQSWLMNIDNFGNGGNIYEVQGHCQNQQVLYNYGNNHPNGRWIHWLISTDNVNGTNIYLDGINVKYDPIFINQTFVTGKKFIFGAYVSNDGTSYGWDANCKPFNGKLDDIRIYNRALSASEVSYLATH